MQVFRHGREGTSSKTLQELLVGLDSGYRCDVPLPISLTPRALHRPRGFGLAAHRAWIRIRARHLPYSPFGDMPVGGCYTFEPSMLNGVCQSPVLVLVVPGGIGGSFRFTIGLG